MTEDKIADELVEPEYTFNFDEITTDDIIEFRQEGNYLIGRTRNGTTFSRRIPNGKMLNMKDGKYILQDISVAAQGS